MRKILLLFIFLHLSLIAFVSTHTYYYLPKSFIFSKMQSASLIYAKITRHNLRYSLFAPAVPPELISKIECEDTAGNIKLADLTFGSREMEIRLNRVAVFLYKEEFRDIILQSWVDYLKHQDPSIRKCTVYLYKNDLEPMHQNGKTVKTLFYKRAF